MEKEPLSLDHDARREISQVRLGIKDELLQEGLSEGSLR